MLQKQHAQYPASQSAVRPVGVPVQPEMLHPPGTGTSSRAGGVAAFLLTGSRQQVVLGLPVQADRGGQRPAHPDGA